MKEAFPSLKVSHILPFINALTAVGALMTLMVIVYLILITSSIASLCHFLLIVLEFGVLLATYTKYLSQIDRLVRRAFRCWHIQHESSIQQVIKDRDVRLWRSIMGASSHPLKDLLPPLKNTGLHAVGRILTRSTC